MHWTAETTAAVMGMPCIENVDPRSEKKCIHPRSSTWHPAIVTSPPSRTSSSPRLHLEHPPSMANRRKSGGGGGGGVCARRGKHRPTPGILMGSSEWRKREKLSHSRFDPSPRSLNSPPMDSKLSTSQTSKRSCTIVVTGRTGDRFRPVPPPSARLEPPVALASSMSGFSRRKKELQPRELSPTVELSDSPDSTPSTSSGSTRSSTVNRRSRRSTRPNRCTATSLYHPYVLTHAEVSSHRAFQAARRRERSRLAAQVRRNRESQTLMLVKNALPIATDLFAWTGPLQAPVTEKKRDSKRSLGEDDLGDLNASVDAVDSEEEEGETHGKAIEMWLEGAAASAAINLERSDVIRIAGHTLFLLNHVQQHLGRSNPITMHLHSHSLHGLLIDTVDLRIVYVTPALSEALDANWISLIGAPLHQIVRPDSLDSLILRWSANSRRKSSTLITQLERNHHSSSLARILTDPSASSASSSHPSFHTAFSSSSSSCAAQFISMNKMCSYPEDMTPASSDSVFPPPPQQQQCVAGASASSSSYKRRSRRGRQWSRKSKRSTFAAIHVPDTNSDLIYHCWMTIPVESTFYPASNERVSSADGEETPAPTVTNSQGRLQLCLLQPIDTKPSKGALTNSTNQIDEQVPNLASPVILDQSSVALDQSDPTDVMDDQNHSKVTDLWPLETTDLAPPPPPPHSPTPIDEETETADSTVAFPTLDLSSLLTEQLETADDRWFMRLDDQLSIQASSLPVSHVTDFLSVESHDLIGQQFLNMVHLDDLRALCNAFRRALRTQSRVWTALYRLRWDGYCLQGDTTSRWRPYVWIRSLLHPKQTDDPIAVAWHCWHQFAGCESIDSSPSIALTVEHRSIPVIPEPIAPSFCSVNKILLTIQPTQQQSRQTPFSKSAQPPTSTTTVTQRHCVFVLARSPLVRLPRNVTVKQTTGLSTKTLLLRPLMTPVYPFNPQWADPKGQQLSSRDAYQHYSASSVVLPETTITVTNSPPSAAEKQWRPRIMRRTLGTPGAGGRVKSYRTGLGARLIEERQQRVYQPANQTANTVSTLPHPCQLPTLLHDTHQHVQPTYEVQSSSSHGVSTFTSDCEERGSLQTPDTTSLSESSPSCPSGGEQASSFTPPPSSSCMPPMHDALGMPYRLDSSCDSDIALHNLSWVSGGELVTNSSSTPIHNSPAWTMQNEDPFSFTDWQMETQIT